MKMSDKARYIYRGPVMGFDRLLCSVFEAETVASSEKEAKRNLEYQFKKKANLSPTSFITLSGKIVRLEQYL